MTSRLPKRVKIRNYLCANLDPETWYSSRQLYEKLNEHFYQGVYPVEVSKIVVPYMERRRIKDRNVYKLREDAVMRNENE